MYTGNHEQILEKIATLNETLAKMIAAADKDADVDPKVLDIRCKTIKQMIMEVDNSLGDLHDMLDTMQEYDEENWPHQADDHGSRQLFRRSARHARYHARV